MAVAAIASRPWIADLGSGAVPRPVALQPVVALAATVLSQGALWALVFMLTGRRAGDGIAAGSRLRPTRFGNTAVAAWAKGWSLAASS